VDVVVIVTGYDGDNFGFYRVVIGRFFGVIMPNISFVLEKFRVAVSSLAEYFCALAAISSVRARTLCVSVSFAYAYNTAQATDVGYYGKVLTHSPQGL